MKLQLALITAVLAVSTTVAQAADTRTPDILGSVSGGSVQTLSKADASKTRGEYWKCTYVNGGQNGNCSVETSYGAKPDYQKIGSTIITRSQWWGGYAGYAGYGYYVTR